MEESGFKPLAAQWIGAYVNSKTPPEVIKKLSDAFAKAIADPTVKEQFSRIVFNTIATGQQATAKAVNFKNSQKKLAYRYLLTPRGIEAKTRLTLRFLRTKMDEYEMLKLEIEQIRREAEDRRVQE